MSTKVCKVQWFRLLACLRIKSENRPHVLTNVDDVKLNINRCYNSRPSRIIDYIFTTF